MRVKAAMHEVLKMRFFDASRRFAKGESGCDMAAEMLGVSESAVERGSVNAYAASIDQLYLLSADTKRRDPPLSTPRLLSPTHSNQEPIPTAFPAPAKISPGKRRFRGQVDTLCIARHALHGRAKFPRSRISQHRVKHRGRFCDITWGKKYL